MDIKDILIRLVQETKVDYKWRIDNAKDDSFSYSTDDEHNVKTALTSICPKEPEPKQEERIKESDERRIIDEQDITIRTYLERRIDNIKQDLIEHIYNYHTTKQPSSLYPHEIAEKVNELIDVLNNAIGKLREVGR